MLKAKCNALREENETELLIEQGLSSPNWARARFFDPNDGNGDSQQSSETPAWILDDQLDRDISFVYAPHIAEEDARGKQGMKASTEKEVRSKRKSSQGSDHTSAKSSMADRAAKLNAVYLEFDVDHNGTIGEEEVDLLRTACSEIGETSSGWSHDPNEDMYHEMCAYSDRGNVTMTNFLMYFMDLLSSENDDSFDRFIEEFTDCAKKNKRGPKTEWRKPRQGHGLLREVKEAKDRRAEDAARLAGEEEKRLQKVEALLL